MDKVFESSVLDRLIGHPTEPQGDGRMRLTLEELKASVARDLTALLNTRLVITPDEMEAHPACQRSILNYGLRDFSALSLTSSKNRETICVALREAIERFEPRLTGVKITLVRRRGGLNRLSFVIAATLAARPDESVCFDGAFEPSSLQYVVRQATQL
ncbi:type VI secretion system baseplate subunit TssE [Massilia horti]|uniref:Type VI secretion system baseplate subunit TssE n=1 Tax=Massilia horti TaxID=2562153 RepID=A0A4Y9T2M1_9BURK|nr:type VI secretion system baseplate subunit TssE [Massilia horti]TFW31771.1 type VI secretion system baseplate subunit TssE [Massilia horti]